MLGFLNSVFYKKNYEILKEFFFNDICIVIVYSKLFFFFVDNFFLVSIFK